MQINFYRHKKRINSTLRPTGGGTPITFVYKDTSDIHNPIVQVSQWDDTWNYASIGALFFYVARAKRVSNSITEVELKLDSMATYKDYITGTHAFVKYGEQGVDNTIPDGRFIKSLEPKITAKAVNASYFENTPKLILTVFGQGGLPSYYGNMTRTYAPTPVQAFMFANQVCAITDDIATELRKIFNNPYDSIISMRLVYAKIGAAYGENTDMIIGNYNTGISAFEVWNRVISGSDTISIPWEYGDWRDGSQSTKLFLYVPGYGVVTLSPAEFYGQAAIKVNYAIDAMTGEVAFDIALANGTIVTTFQANLGVEVPVGQTKTGLQGALNNILGMAGSLSNPVAFAQNAIGMEMSVLSQTTTTRGQLGGAAQSGLFADYVLTLVTNAPKEYNPGSVYGKPVSSVQQLTAGYVECQGASVSAPAYAGELQEINGYLNSGAWIE